MSDADRVDGRDAAEDQGELRFREGGRFRHEADVAHGTVATDGDVEQRCADSSREDSAFERAATRVGDVQNELVNKRLHRQARSREEKLFMGLAVTVYP